jgi:hypothetical protein
MDGLELVFIIAVVVIAGLAAAFSNRGVTRGATIEGDRVLVSELEEHARLSGAGVWDISIFRRSGYLHDVHVVAGSAQDAVRSALTSCKRSQIGEVIVKDNSETRLEFWATRLDLGRARAIGGFVVELRPIEAVPQESELTLAAIREELEDIKLKIARLLWENAKLQLPEEAQIVLGDMPDEVIIGHIARQIKSVGDDGRLEVNIPVEYTGPGGNHHKGFNLCFNLRPESKGFVNKT